MNHGLTQLVFWTPILMMTMITVVFMEVKPELLSQFFFYKNCYLVF